MENIRSALNSVFKNLSDQRYEQSFAYFRFWFGIGQTYSQIPPDLIFDTIYGNRTTGHSHNNSIYPTAHLVLRFVSDAESDPILAPHSTGLRSRFCTRVLQEFFDSDLRTLYGYYGRPYDSYYMDVNIVAHCANLGYLEEDTIRSHILQSLISHHKLHDHQADALIILFKIAGATFGAYVDPAVVDRCFVLLKNHQSRHNLTTGPLIEVSAFSVQRHWNSDKTPGSNEAPGTRLGGSPSSSCVHNQETKPDWRGPKRSQRNSHCHIPGASQGGLRTSDSSAP